MIQPTIGRVVWFQPPAPAGQPLRSQPYAAMIAYVHSDSCIDVGYVNENGTAAMACSVPLIQEGQEPPANGCFAQWTPYQVGKAKKQEAQPPQDNAHVAPVCEKFSEPPAA